MFRSAASQVGSTSSLNSTRSSSAYQSFQSVFKETARASTKRPIEESSDSSDDDVRIMETSDADPEIVHENIRSRHKKKKDKKKHKSHKKKSKKRRRLSSSSSSASDMEVAPSQHSDSSIFCYHTFKKHIDYNSKFAKELKKRKLAMDSNLPLTTSHDPHELRMKFYSSGEQSMNWRYFSMGNIENLKKGATERVFRSYPKIKVEVDFIPLSKGPFKPEEEDDAQIYAEYSESMSLEDYRLMKDRRWADPDAMSMEQKQKLVNKDVNDNRRNVYQWLHFLKFEEEFFAYKNQLNGRSRDFGRASYLERREEIIKSGLKSVHRDEAVQLKLEMMKTLIERFGSHHEIVEREWMKVQIDYVNSEPMWKAYIADRLHKLSGFSIVNAEKPYTHAIERLNNLLNGILVSHKVLDGTEDFLIDLVVARCKLFLEAGFVSHVIGNLQAIAEFMLFSSADTKQQRHTYQVQQFKEFWESGMPRIGDADAKGWKDTIYDRSEQNKANEKKIANEEKMSNQNEDDESKMPQLFIQTINYTLSAIWSEIEKKRSERFWTPVTPIPEFNDKDRFQFIDERIIKFECVKPSLIRLSSPTNALRLIFRILQLFGVKVPGITDTTQQGIIEEILPGDFDHLRPKYHEIRDFFIEFLTKLATTTENIEIGYVLSTIVSTAIYFLNVEDIDEDRKTSYLNGLQKQIREWPAVGKDTSHRFFALLNLLDVRAESLQLVSSWTGLELLSIEDDNRPTRLMEIVKVYLTMVGVTDPCDVTNPKKKQLLLQTALSLVRRLPSSQASGNKSKFNRLRFLVLLVTSDKEIENFLKMDYELTQDAISKATERWEGYYSSVLKSDKTTKDDQSFTFMHSTNDTIFMLYAIFYFEKNGCTLFDTFDSNLSLFVYRSPERTLLRLNYVEEMVKQHRFRRPQYSRWIEKAIKHFPQHPPFFRHLSNSLAAMPCHIIQMAKWKTIKDSNQKRMFALAFFGAKIQIYKKAQENDDTLWSRTVSKQIKEILEDAVPILSESFMPESLIWRIWFYIQSELQHRTEIDKLYTLGVRSCPYSKQFLLDVTKSPFTNTGRLKEIIDLANKHNLCIFTVFKEAEYTNEAIDRDPTMAQHFDNTAGFGMDRPSGFRALSHPMIVLSHVGFRGAALFVYFFANWFWSSFIVQFLIILTLLSADFWTVKNITGRLLVGLRWWNIVDSEGKNHWKFESAKDTTRFDATERYIFWMGLIIAPALWILFVATAFLTFKWEWMVIAVLGSGMSLANLYGYLRCKWNNTTEMTNYFTKLAFLSFLTRPSAPQQPGQTATV
ncbi:hypothetical protein M3Y94_01167000 [Aphelenchoides besseyi]|nr:hypothetical protein M3Y94_01167000 [Aphelenchoides besseyi]KAI6228115.1 hypothetical protein M3Y95_00588300 [Aphelenchoides besseyi]